ncbi:MAG TPA: CPBP family intramembrane metalloprotease [Ruminococcus flavefaciens]|nr:CPBP family intramembrane metalloprotease [Ruminococcus flavefaciens]
MIKNKKLTAVLIIYTVLFYGVWAWFELVAAEKLSAHFGTEFVTEFAKCGVKLAVWALPAFILIKIFNKNMYIKMPNMFSDRFMARWWLLFAAMVGYFLFVSYRAHGTVKLADDIRWEMLIPYILVGLSEELVFRGWLLNATMKDSDKLILPVAVNAVMFTLIHFPIWYHMGVLEHNLTHFLFLQIIGLSVLFSWTFIRSRNIVFTMLLHSAYDILVLLFLGS